MSEPSDRPVALITGASSGLGTEFARLMAARKHDLVISARREDRLQALAGELRSAHGVKVDIVTEDLSRHGGADSLIAKVEALGRPIDVLVNNAGFGLHGNFVAHEPARVDEMLELNVTALTRLTHHYARAMVARKRGHVLQVSSIGGFQPSPYYGAYSATKAYVLFLGEALHYELRGTGVSCTTLCPGVTATEFHDAANHPKTGIVGATMMTARAVAAAGIAAMLRGRAVIMPGLPNQLTAFFVRFLPRSWVVWMAARMMK